MNAALTFSPGQALSVAIVAACLVLVIVWGMFEAEHDRVERARTRQRQHEAKHAKEGIER